MAKRKKALTLIGIKALPPAPAGQQIEHFDALLPGFALRVTSKGDKSFIMMTRLNGKQIRLTVGKAQIEDDGPGLSLAAARDIARGWVMMCQKGEDPRTVKKAAEKATEAPTLPLQEAFTVKKAVADYEKRQISKLKPRSQLEARRPLTKILVAKWADRALTEVSKADIRAALEDMVDNGTPVAANRALAAMKAFFGWCVNKDYLTANPCVGIDPPGGDESSRDRILSDDEIQKLWPLMSEASYPFGVMAQFLLVTGQRRDEVAKLLWSEISSLNGNNPIWTIPAEKNKAGRLHEVPLSPLAVQILHTLPRIAIAFPAGKPSVLSDFVFTTNGRAPISGFSGGKERLDAETSKAGIKLAHWIIHDLRRTAASGMARAEIEPHIVSRVLNHSQGKAEGITAVYNRHGYLREKRHALETWGAKLETVITMEKTK